MRYHEAIRDELDARLLPVASTYKDDFLLTAPAGTTIVARLASAAFDAYLSVVNAENGRVVQSNDDGSGGSDAAITFTPQAGVAYLLRASSASRILFTVQPGISYVAKVSSAFEAEVGSYWLSAQRLTSIAPVSSTPGTLTTSDAIDHRYLDVYRIDDYELVGASVGQSFTVRMNSTAVDA